LNPFKMLAIYTHIQTYIQTDVSVIHLLCHNNKKETKQNPDKKTNIIHKSRRRKI